MSVIPQVEGLGYSSFADHNAIDDELNRGASFGERFVEHFGALALRRHEAARLAAPRVGRGFDSGGAAGGQGRP
jgi:hypothetical protein